MDWIKYSKTWDEWLLQRTGRYELIFTPEEIDAEQFLKSPLRIVYEVENMSKINVNITSVTEIVNGVWCHINLKDEDLIKDNNGVIFKHADYIRKYVVVDIFNILRNGFYWGIPFSGEILDGINEETIIFNPNVWRKQFLNERQYLEYTISMREDKLKRITK